MAKIGYNKEGLEVHEHKNGHRELFEKDGIKSVGGYTVVNTHPLDKNFNPIFNTTEELKLKPMPVPPFIHMKTCSHHWLKVVDGDGHFFEYVVALWNPGAKQWSNSGCAGTDQYLDTKYWEYMAPCPMPEF